MHNHPLWATGLFLSRVVSKTGMFLYLFLSQPCNLGCIYCKGDLIKWYPADFGPDYLNVKSVE
jgi:hypothetical protein